MPANSDLTPELTLTPYLSAAAPAAPEAPTLTLDPTPAAAQTAPVDEAALQAQREANAVKLDESRLSEAERKMVDDFAQKIGITDANWVLQ